VTPPETPAERRHRIATAPSSEANCCEHGDHPAPVGKRFCSEACCRCEHESTNAETGCDNICGLGAPTEPTPAPLPPCVQCGKTINEERRVYAIPTCYACLPPPEPLPVVWIPGTEPAPLASGPMTAEDVERVYQAEYLRIPEGATIASSRAVALLAVAQEARRRARAEVLAELRAVDLDEVCRRANAEAVRNGVGALARPVSVGIAVRAALLGAVEGGSK
jgi:hypothetical protein